MSDKSRIVKLLLVSQQSLATQLTLMKKKGKQHQVQEKVLSVRTEK